MAVTGVVHPERIWRNVGARPGDVLVLTKALGTGIVTTARKRGRRHAGRASHRDREHAHAERRGARARCAISRCTPAPTSPASRSSATASRWRTAAACASWWTRRACRRSPAPAPSRGRTADRRLPPQPRLAGRPRRISADVPADLVEVAFDPQTSGGLLAAIPAATPDAAVAALHAAGVEAATIVGAVRERPDGPWIVLH